MGVINPYSQPELEDKGWEFKSDDVTVKPDDGSVTMQSLDEELTALAQACKALTDDGYVFAIEGKGTTPLPVADYNRYWFRAGQANNNQHALLRLSLQEAGSDTVETKELLSMLDRVGTDSIQDNAVTRDKIADNAVTVGKIADNAVLYENIEYFAVKENSIAPNAVTSQKIAANAVTSRNIAANAVTQGKIAADAVVTENIENGAVTNEKLSDGSVSETSLNNDLKERIGKIWDFKAMPLPSQINSYEVISEEDWVRITGTQGFSVLKDIAAAGIGRIRVNAQSKTQISWFDILSVAFYAKPIGAFRIFMLLKGAASSGGYIEIADFFYESENKVSVGQFRIRTTHGTYKYFGGTLGESAMYKELVSLLDKQIPPDKIATGAVTEDKIATGAVTEDKIATGAVTNEKLSNEMQATLNKVPKQYELTTTLDNETEMTPDAFLAKYGVSVDVIKGLRVGDSLKATTFTYGVVAVNDENPDYGIQLMDAVYDEINSTYAAFITITEGNINIRSYRLLHDDREQILVSTQLGVTDLPWGTTVQVSESATTILGLTPSQWMDMLVGTVLVDLSKTVDIYGISHRVGDVLYLGQYNEPQTDGTAKQIQYSIRLRYNDNHTALTSISFYADEIESGSAKVYDVNLPWGTSVTMADVESATLQNFNFWLTLSAGTVLKNIQRSGTWVVERVQWVNTGKYRIYLGCYYNEDEEATPTGKTIQRSILVKDTDYWGGTDALTFDAVELPVPYVPVEYTLPVDFPYNDTVSKRYVSDVIGTVASGKKLNEGDVFVYGNNRYKIVSKSAKPSGTGDYKTYSFCFECSTFNGNSYGQNGATGYGGLFFTDGEDGCVVYTVQYDEAPASSESLIDDVQWAATGQKAGFVMLSGEPTGTIEPVPYNRIWAECYTAGSFDKPTINIKVIYANSTTKTTAIGYSFANNIGTPCLRAKCVTSEKIANKAVTSDKLGNDVFASKIYALTQDLIFDTRYTPTTYNAAFGMLFDVWADYVDGTGKAPVLTVADTGSQVKKYVAGTVSAAGANRWMIDLGCVYDVDTSTPVRAYAILEWDEADAEWDAITFKKG